MSIRQISHYRVLDRIGSGGMSAVCKDGKHLAFSRGHRKTDVVMMSNFR